MIRFEDLNVECTSRHFLIKDNLRLKRSVVISHASMVTTNNKVSCAHILTENSMQNAFTWSGIQHVEAITRNHCTVRREVQLNHFTDRSITNRCRDIALFQFAKQHMDNQAITTQALQCTG